MADYAVYNMPICQTYYAISTATPTTQVLDASNDGAGAIFIAPKAGSITAIGCNITAKVGTAPTYRFAIEGVLDNNDEPDGTIKGAGNSAYVDAADPATGFAWRTLGTALTVAAGDRLAATIRYTGASTIDADHCITVALKAVGVNTNLPVPFNVALTGGTWATNANPPAIAVRYSTGWVVPMMLAYDSLAYESWSTSVTAGRYRGNKWTPPFDCRCTGVILSMRPSATSDFNVKVFSGTNTTPVASLAIEGDEVYGTVGGAYPAFLPLEPFSLTASTIYRFVVEPTTANAITGFPKIVFPSADAYARQAIFSDLKGAYGTSGGSPDPEWTGESDDTVYCIVPVIDQISVTTSGYNLPIIGSGLVY